MFKIIVLCLLGFALVAAWQILIKIKVTEKYRNRYLLKAVPANNAIEVQADRSVEGLIIEIE